nr:MAG TPA: hypothetical protein [Caudoviricetes sp.]
MKEMQKLILHILHCRNFAFFLRSFLTWISKKKPLLLLRFKSELTMKRNKQRK